MAKTLTRSRTDKYLAGVCGGLAEYFNIDANIVRIGVVILTLFTMPFGWLFYPALWLLLPYSDGGPSGLDSLKQTFGNNNEQR